STYDLERRLDRAQALILLRDADERRAARQDKEAAEKRRQALRLLGGDGPEAEAVASQHAKNLLELASKLSPEDAEAYHEELMAAARAREGERDFRAALIALRDAKLFVSGEQA